MMIQILKLATPKLQSTCQILSVKNQNRAVSPLNHQSHQEYQNQKYQNFERSNP